jgi:hypothetical protein
MVSSSAFAQASQVQADALGIEPARVFVPHPIQDRSDDEMRALAEGALEDIVKALVVAD